MIKHYQKNKGEGCDMDELYDRCPTHIMRRSSNGNTTLINLIRKQYRATFHTHYKTEYKIIKKLTTNTNTSLERKKYWNRPTSKQRNMGGMLVFIEPSNPGKAKKRP